MKNRLILALAFVVYVLFLLLVTGAYLLHWQMILFITIGLAFGILLPAIACSLSEILLTEHVVISLALLKSFFSKVWQESETRIPVTRTGRTIYSYPFLFAFGVLALYIVTSSGGWFGKALVLGLGLRLVADLLLSSRDRTLFLERWFGLFKANLSKLEETVLVYGSLLFWLILTLLAIKN